MSSDGPPQDSAAGTAENYGDTKDIVLVDMTAVDSSEPIGYTAANNADAGPGNTQSQNTTIKPKSRQSLGGMTVMTTYTNIGSMPDTYAESTLEYQKQANLNGGSNLPMAYFSVEEIQRVMQIEPGYRKWERYNRGEIKWIWNKEIGAFENIKERVLLILKKRLTSYLFTIFLTILFAFGYMQAANHAATRYIKWMKDLRNIGGMINEEGDNGKTLVSPTYPTLPVRNNPGNVPAQGRLPDMILDNFLSEPSNTENTFVTQLSDVMPMILYGFAIALLVLGDHFVMGIIAGNMFAFNWFFNMLAENMTILPSSYGYDRCINTRYASGPLVHGDDHPYEAMNTTGSCAAMMWSGHTWNVLVGSYWLSSGLRFHFPEFLGKKLCVPLRRCCGKTRTFSSWVLTPQGLFVTFMTLLEALLLLIDWSHYSIDVFISILLGLFIISNEKIIFWLYYVNPIAASKIPFESNYYYQRLRMRKILALKKSGKMLEYYDSIDDVVYNPWNKVDVEMIGKDDLDKEGK